MLVSHSLGVENSNCRWEVLVQAVKATDPGLDTEALHHPSGCFPVFGLKPVYPSASVAVRGSPCL